MKHNDDAYAAMLLTMALSPNKEEYARPLSVQEFRQLERSVGNSGMGFRKKRPDQTYAIPIEYPTRWFQVEITRAIESPPHPQTP